MYRILLFCFLLISQIAWAAESHYRLEAYGSITRQEWNQGSPFNTDNKILEVPDWIDTLEFRPDLQFALTENKSFTLRSRHFLRYTQTETENPNHLHELIKGDSDLTDAFFSSGWSDAISTTMGLQNYQWGPAEIFSPSNVFFHFQNDQRSFFYKEKGHVLARMNWTPDPNSAKWSVVALYEPIHNKTKVWMADEEFKPKSAIKVEYQFDNPANSVALIGGQGEEERGYWGEYFNWSPAEGYSFYIDAKHQKGRTNYVPQKNGLGFYDLVKSDNQNIYTLAVAGFRWERRVDFRQEFVYNQMGYSENEWRLAKQSALTLSPNILTNADRFKSPGLEFRTQVYSYSSIRIPDLGSSQNTTISARWLSSLVMNTGALQLDVENNWNDSTVLSAEFIQFTGSKSNEFRIVADQQISLGFRWTY